MIDRRAALAAIGGLGITATTTATRVRAQTARPLPVIAFFANTIPSPDLAGPSPRSLLYRALLKGLRDSGWINGSTAVIEAISADGAPEREDAILADLIARKVDVIVMGPARGLQHKALAATKTIPIIAIFGDDPVAVGVVQSLGRPGRNITGLTVSSGPEIYGKRLQLLREIAPAVRRTMFLSRPEEFAGVKAVARPAGLDLLHQPITTIEGIDAGLTAALGSKPDSLMVAGGPPFFSQAARFATFALEHKLPAIFNQRAAAEAGGLLAYGPNVLDSYAKLARLVDLVLRGRPVAEIPIEQPTRFELVLNARTAKSLGLTPPPTLLTLADEVIE